MRNFNRPACNRYKARSVEVVVSQYLIACCKRNQMIQAQSQALLTLETSGWIVEPTMAAPDSTPDPDVYVAIQLDTT